MSVIELYCFQLYIKELHKFFQTISLFKEVLDYHRQVESILSIIQNNGPAIYTCLSMGPAIIK